MQQSSEKHPGLLRQGWEGVKRLLSRSRSRSRSSSRIHPLTNANKIGEITTDSGELVPGVHLKSPVHTRTERKTIHSQGDVEALTTKLPVQQSKPGTKRRSNPIVVPQTLMEVPTRRSTPVMPSPIHDESVPVKISITSPGDLKSMPDPHTDNTGLTTQVSSVKSQDNSEESKQKPTTSTDSLTSSSQMKTQGSCTETSTDSGLAFVILDTSSQDKSSNISSAYSVKDISTNKSILGKESKYNTINKIMNRDSLSKQDASSNTSSAQSVKDTGTSKPSIDSLKVSRNDASSNTASVQSVRDTGTNKPSLDSVNKSRHDASSNTPSVLSVKDTGTNKPSLDSLKESRHDTSSNTSSMQLVIDTGTNKQSFNPLKESKHDASRSTSSVQSLKYIGAKKASLDSLKVHTHASSNITNETENETQTNKLSLDPLKQSIHDAGNDSTNLHSAKDDETDKKLHSLDARAQNAEGSKDQRNSVTDVETDKSSHGADKKSVQDARICSSSLNSPQITSNTPSTKSMNNSKHEPSKSLARLNSAKDASTNTPSHDSNEEPAYDARRHTKHYINVNALGLGSIYESEYNERIIAVSDIFKEDQQASNIRITSAIALQKSRQALHAHSVNIDANTKKGKQGFSTDVISRDDSKEIKEASSAKTTRKDQLEGMQTPDANSSSIYAAVLKENKQASCACVTGTDAFADNKYSSTVGTGTDSLQESKQKLGPNVAPCINVAHMDSIQEREPDLNSNTTSLKLITHICSADTECLDARRGTKQYSTISTVTDSVPEDYGLSKTHASMNSQETSQQPSTNAMHLDLVTESELNPGSKAISMNENNQEANDGVSGLHLQAMSKEITPHHTDSASISQAKSAQNSSTKNTFLDSQVNVKAAKSTSIKDPMKTQSKPSTTGVSKPEISVLSIKGAASSKLLKAISATASSKLKPSAQYLAPGSAAILPSSSCISNTVDFASSFWSLGVPADASKAPKKVNRTKLFVPCKQAIVALICLSNSVCYHACSGRFKCKKKHHHDFSSYGMRFLAV